MKTQRVGDVFQNGHVFKQRVILEHDTDLPPVGGQVGDILSVLEDRALVRADEARQNTQQRGFSAAGRAQNGEKLSILYCEADVL